MAVEKEKKSTGKLIRDLLMVFSLGMVSAVLVALATLYYFGPTGSYKAENILLSPEVMAQLSFSDISPQTGTPIPYTFDRIEFQHFNVETREWRRSTVDKEAYANFYSMISGDRSLTVVPEDVISFFNKQSPSTLTLTVKKKGVNSGSEESRTFQEVQILNFNDYYRIQIHDKEEVISWAYFYHENIFQKSLELLLPE